MKPFGFDISNPYTNNWIPAFAGMTNKTVFLYPFLTPQRLPYWYSHLALKVGIFAKKSRGGYGSTRASTESFDGEPLRTVEPLSRTSSPS